MPHVCFVSFTGLRIHEERLLAVGMTLPGLVERGSAVEALPGLGLLTLAGMLPEEWTCSYHSFTNNQEELANLVIRETPDLVALSALTASVEEAYRFSNKLRSENLQIVIGGLHATVCPEEATQYCDSAVVGEGEAVWLQILDDAKRNQLQSIYRARDAKPLTTWPSPRFDLVGASPPRFTLQTQRGCPLACEFCGASRLLSSFREKPIEAIRHELDAILALNPNPVIELADDNTFAGKRCHEAFFDAFAESKVRYFTEADWRIGTRPELLAGLAASGCLQVLTGIESMVFRYPGMGKKAKELDQIMESVNAIQTAGVAVNGCFIVGADGETLESIDRLVEFILASPFAEVQLTLQTPFPGTALYKRMQTAGRLIPDRSWSYYTLFDLTYTPDILSPQQLEQAFAEALVKIYSPEASRRRRQTRRKVWKRNPRLNSSLPY